MARDFFTERLFRLSPNKWLKNLCCDPLDFMWKNSLLSPRDTWFNGESDDAVKFWMRFVMGFRVRRDFMFFKRDQIIYECPFCNRELVYPIGFESGGDAHMSNATTGIAIGVPRFKVPRARLEGYLADTKKRCHGVWPPKD